MKEYLKEIENLLVKNKDVKRDACGLYRSKISVPVIRKALKNSRLSILRLSDSESLKAWDYVWTNSNHFEVMSMALYFYQGRDISRDDFQKIQTWSNRINCWEHSDDLSKIYADIVESHQNWIIPTLRKWNKSKNSWERRLSVVSLIEYSSKRKRILPFEELICFIRPLLQDQDYYVQKGVGWTIREIYNVYPNKTLEFIKENLFDIQPIAYSAAVARVDGDLKKELNDKRRGFRQLRKTIIKP